MTIEKAAAILTKTYCQGAITHDYYRWWHQEVRKVLRGQYNDEHVRDNKKHITQLF